MIVIDRILMFHIFMADTIDIWYLDLIFQDTLCTVMKDLKLIFKIHILIYYFVSRFIYHVSCVFLHEILSFAEKNVIFFSTGLILIIMYSSHTFMRCK